ncbi:hypothetical protein M407DRAFT_230705 [Tulasnella calospora MUT 4182]|uniref:F-box domain-containing protein n=1 Tax=Tulasnella calospora MUT 4182 TaxID=1051891 RepID=A0A0C3K5V3_9AGAM|nr:hypothetical protein M407DRAFT_230705 [Tulasnella calospora MUT 4182]
MSSTNGTQTTNYAPYTENGSRCTHQRNLFDAFPDELIIYTLSFPSLPTVVRFASTSRRHRSIASTEQIWFPVAFGIIRDNVDPNDTLVDEEFMRNNCHRFLTALDLSAAETTQAWYRIATRLLERVEWTLGWWIGEDDGFAKGCLWRIFIEIDEADRDDEHDDRFLRVIATHIEVVENDEYNLLLQPGGPVWIVSVVPGISTLRLFGGDPWSSPYVHAFPPLSPRLVRQGIVSGYLSLDGHDPLDNDSPSYSARKLQYHRQHLLLGTESWKRIADKQCCWISGKVEQRPMGLWFHPLGFCR